MFAEIAPRYDLMNHLLSLNIDRLWRSKTIRILNLRERVPVLDTCTGTGDLALSISAKLGSETEVVGSDFCREMLTIAREKQKAGPTASSRLNFVEADTQSLPFRNDYFQAVTVAFGLRNVADTQLGLREMMRVCQPGGQVAVLEFSKPTVFGLSHAYNAYFKYILPRVGQSMAKNGSAAYEYLPQSVQEFPSGEDLAKVMRGIGLTDVRMHTMTFGVVTLYVGRKP